MDVKNDNENDSENASAIGDGIDSDSESDNENVTDLMSFELPPVTEGDTGFIGAPEPERAENDNADFGAQETNAKPWAEFERYRGSLSGDGETFDPEIHQCPPSETKTGKWRVKSKAQKKAHGQGEAQVSEENNAPPSNRIEAQKAAYLYGSLHVPVLGTDAGIENVQDLLPLIGSIERYYNENGVRQLPPSLDVVVNAVIYTAQVTQREKVKPRALEIWDKMKGAGKAIASYEITIFGRRVWGWKFADKKPAKKDGE